MEPEAEGTILVRRYRAALVLIRTFLGLVYFTNGLAKLFSFHTVVIGTWTTNLINRADALNIQRNNTASAPGFLHHLGNVVVSNWGVVQWLLTVGELAVGIGLLLGLLSRISAIAGLLLALGTFVFTLGASNTWTYDYLFEPVTLLALSLVPSLPGLDSYLPWTKSLSAKIKSLSARVH
jgi:thiosulfate dehydrogenase [quinone] large subunit